MVKNILIKKLKRNHIAWFIKNHFPLITVKIVFHEILFKIIIVLAVFEIFRKYELKTTLFSYKITILSLLYL